MSRRIILSLVAAVTAAAALSISAGVAGASSTAAAKKTRVVTIAMHDPGCHWFYANKKYTKRLVVHGKIAFRNLDEAALIFKGKHFNRHLAVGKTLTIKKAGVYHITMVKQAPDDNHLLLVVKKK